MNDVEFEEFLDHHGVKGMKWGVRNKKSSTDHKNISNLRKKKTHELSNKQLQKANARANLEKNFRSLNPSKIEAGHSAVKSILGIAGTAVTIHSLVNSPAGKAAITAGKKFLLRY